MDQISAFTARRNGGNNYVERWAREFARVPGREEMPAHVARLKQGE